MDNLKNTLINEIMVSPLFYLILETDNPFELYSPKKN